MSQLLVFKQALDEIKVDNTSGSTSILTSFIHALIELLTSNVEPGLQLETIKKSVASLHQASLEFPILAHFISILQRQLAQKESLSDLQQLIGDYNRQWSDVNNRIATNASNIIDWESKTIMVHSNSSTVVEFFNTISLQQQLPSIIQTESRPNFEGRIQGKILAQLGFNVTIVIDAAMGYYTNQADLAVVGVDAMSHSFFYNKMGTYLLALAFKASNKPFYVLADSRKQINAGSIPPGQPKPNVELYSDPPRGIKLENYYFEATPIGFVTQIIYE